MGKDVEGRVRTGVMSRSLTRGSVLAGVVLTLTGCGTQPVLEEIARDDVARGVGVVMSYVQDADRTGTLGEHDLVAGALRSWAEDPVRDESMGLPSGVWTRWLTIDETPASEQVLLEVAAVARDTTFSEGEARASACLQVTLDPRTPSPDLAAREVPCPEPEDE